MAYEKNIDFDEHISYIIEQVGVIKDNEITILTGPNGYGKSLMRKILSKSITSKIADFSMERRTTPNENFSAFRSMAIDRHDDATSNHSCYMIKSLLSQKDRYYIIDEPEIGLGKEVILGLVEDIRNKITELKEDGSFRGMLIVTHSEFFIDNFPHDRFVNLEGLSLEQWKTRKIRAISPDDLSAWCSELWGAIEKRMSKNKKA